jgi:hypothetical protein
MGILQGGEKKEQAAVTRSSLEDTRSGIAPCTIAVLGLVESEG